MRARIDNVAGYTVTEHYAVFRSHDEVHPAAEMLVKTIYRRGSGKSFTVLSQSGSALLRSEVLGTLLDNEKRMSQPGNLETALIDSANYEMKLVSDPLGNLMGAIAWPFLFRRAGAAPIFLKEHFGLMQETTGLSSLKEQRQRVPSSWQSLRRYRANMPT